MTYRRMCSKCHRHYKPTDDSGVIPGFEDLPESWKEQFRKLRQENRSLRTRLNYGPEEVTT